jgi:hypothetical protein
MCHGEVNALLARSIISARKRGPGCYSIESRCVFFNGRGDVTLSDGRFYLSSTLRATTL